MIAVMTFFVSCSKEESLITTTEVQKTKNISNKSGFTPKGKLIIENYTNLVFEFNLVCSGGSQGSVATNNSNSQNNTFINPNINLSQNQIIDASTVKSYNDFCTNTSSNTIWKTRTTVGTTSTTTNVNCVDANLNYMMPNGINPNYAVWQVLKGRIYGTITDPNNLNNSVSINTGSNLCKMSLNAINNGDFGWEFPFYSTTVNFVNYTKFKLQFIAIVNSDSDTVLTIKQNLE